MESTQAAEEEACYLPGPVDENHQLKEMLLIDLRRDPGERYNIIGQNPLELKKLIDLAEDARKDLGDDLTNSKGENIRPCSVAE